MRIDKHEYWTTEPVAALAGYFSALPATPAPRPFDPAAYAGPLVSLAPTVSQWPADMPRALRGEARLRVPQAAAAFGVNIATILRWDSEGVIVSRRDHAAGRLFFAASDLRALWLSRSKVGADEAA